MTNGIIDQHYILIFKFCKSTKYLVIDQLNLAHILSYTASIVSKVNRMAQHALLSCIVVYSLTYT